MKHVFILFLLLPALHSTAQFCVPADPGGRFIKKDATGFYFAGERDSGSVVFYAADSTYYLKTGADGIPIEEGGLIGSGAQWRGKQGRWTTNYAGGYPRVITNFCAGHEVGEHIDYFPDGEVQHRYTLAWLDWPGMGKPGAAQSFLSGLYQAYYDNGKLAEEGYYKLAQDNGVPVLDSVAAKDDKSATQPAGFSVRSVPCGIWRYYNKDGSFNRFKVFH